MFKSWNIKYPEYEIICPQTKLSFTLKSLNVSEEERMKSSLLTNQRILEHLNKCIFDNLVKKPENVSDYDSFLKNVTIRDREALLYGLYHITYEDIRNYSIECPKCSKKYNINIKASESFNFNMYKGKDNIIEKRVKKDLKSSPGISVYIKQPTLWDEVHYKSKLVYKSDELFQETLIIDKFEQDIPDHKNSATYNDRQDIIYAYMELPARDKRLIYETYLEEFGKYEVSMKMKTICTNPKCSQEDIVTIDLVEQFFRMVYTS